MERFSEHLLSEPLYVNKNMLSPEKYNCERCFIVLNMLIRWVYAQVYTQPSPLLHTWTFPRKCGGQARVRETILFERLSIHLAAHIHYTTSAQGALSKPFHNPSVLVQKIQVVCPTSLQESIEIPTALVTGRSHSPRAFIKDNSCHRSSSWTH